MAPTRQCPTSERPGVGRSRAAFSRHRSNNGTTQETYSAQPVYLATIQQPLPPEIRFTHPPKTLTFAPAEAAKTRGPRQIALEYRPKTLLKSLTFDRNRSSLAHPQHGHIQLPKRLTILTNH